MPGIPYRLSAYSIVGQFYLAAEQYDSAKMYLNKAIRLWEMRKAEFLADPALAPPLEPLYILYNSLGIFYINYEMNYEQAVRYFTEGLEWGRRYPEQAGDIQSYQILVYNLVMSCFIRGSSDGLSLAERVLRDGEESRSEVLIYLGAFGCAMMHFQLGDFQEAARYTEQCLSSPYALEDKMFLSNLYANILFAQDRPEEAMEYYNEAFRLMDLSNVMEATYVYLSYGKFLLARGNVPAAIDRLREGLMLAGISRNKVFTYQLFRVLSDAYAMQGEWRKALEVYRCYDEQTDSIFNLVKERTVQELMLQYETARKESELQENRIRLMKQERILAVSLSLSLLIVLFSVIGFLYYHGRQKMFRRTVEQYHQSLNRERVLAEKILEQEQIRQDTVPEPFRRKQNELIRRLEDGMRMEKWYCDPLLTREKLADLLGTNRTYLSKAVNEFSGKTVSQYINSYRILHAVEMLSDPEADYPLKVVEHESGFNASSNFFKLFREQVGMSPRQYRIQTREINLQRERQKGSTAVNLTK